ncbi:hypothetical protein KAI32_04210 [Candidatus Pacearchaeota archaeon]|nr:hypothetical protein [Candidatus Pacearchaeota archaeon]
MENIKLIGSKFTKINAERKQNFTGKLTINTNIQIKDLEKIEEMKDTLKASYEFEITYNELGKINIEGNVFVSAASKIIKELLKSWDDKKFETPEHVQITNYIIQKASIKAFELEEELGLPIHIRLPTLSPKKD